MNEDKWISTKERFPDNYGSYLAIYYTVIKDNGTFRDTHVIGVLSYRGTVWINESGYYIHNINVKYWQPLPEFPEEFEVIICQ